MEGNLIGVFGSNPQSKQAFLSSIGKKSETEGMVVYQRNEGGKKFSFLDDQTYPEKIQGYARIASISDYSYYLFPPDGKLQPSDGELAILLDSFNLPGSIEVLDGSKAAAASVIASSFKGLAPASFDIDERDSKSWVIDLSKVSSGRKYPRDSTLVYIDRAFNVKGVGLVVLGFVLSGKVSVHDRLRLIPSDAEKYAEVKGIQVSDEDYDTTGRGIRVGLSLKGVELKDLSKVSWMDDGSLKLSSEINFEFRQSRYYKQPTADRDLHLQANGETLVARVSQGAGGGNQRTAKLTASIPVWQDMRVCVLDLNSKPLRLAGGGTVIL